MIETEPDYEPAELNRTRLATASLTAVSVLVALAAVAWGLARIVELSRPDAFSAAELLATLALLLAGVGVALLLWATAEFLRKLETVVDLLSERPSASAEARMPSFPARAETSQKMSDELKSALEELVNLTREVRDISMLSEEERSARLEAQGRALASELQREIPTLLQQHRWVEARQRVQRARERFPAIKEWDELEQKIEAMRANVEAHDVESATRQVDDLIALDAFDRAFEVVRELLDRHPDSEPAQSLAKRVTMQREKVHAELRARLMAQAQEAVDRREWNRALSLANELIRQHPRSPEAEALRQQLPTLTANAEIQTRQKMEQQFRELMKRHDYGAALQLARELIEQYPHSPQAQVLREQLPRLEEKAGVKP